LRIGIFLGESEMKAISFQQLIMKKLWNTIFRK